MFSVCLHSIKAMFLLPVVIMCASPLLYTQSNYSKERLYWLSITIVYS